MILPNTETKCDNLNSCYFNKCTHLLVSLWFMWLAFFRFIYCFCSERLNVDARTISIFFGHRLSCRAPDFYFISPVVLCCPFHSLRSEYFTITWESDQKAKQNEKIRKFDAFINAVVNLFMSICFLNKKKSNNNKEHKHFAHPLFVYCLANSEYSDSERRIIQITGKWISHLNKNNEKREKAQSKHHLMDSIFVSSNFSYLNYNSICIFVQLLFYKGKREEKMVWLLSVLFSMVILMWVFIFCSFCKRWDYSFRYCHQKRKKHIFLYRF